jgi:hypothetical protein
MYYCDMIPSGRGEMDRKAARYRLAMLLSLEQFKEAESLSEKWLKENVILSEDHAFVVGILHGAANTPKGPVSFRLSPV